MAHREDQGPTLFDKIKDLILDEGLQTGDLLPSEPQLVERFQCSRSAIREALKQLQTLGLVEVRRGIGSYVGPFAVKPLLESVAFGAIVRFRTQPTAFLELLEVRIALDLGMARRMCEKYAGADTSDLDAIVDDMIAAANAGDSLVTLDKEFHRQMYADLGNAFASDLMNNFWTLIRVIGLDKHHLPAFTPLETAKAHGTLVSAARAGDLRGYEQAVFEHYRGSREQALLLANEQHLDDRGVLPLMGWT